MGPALHVSWMGEFTHRRMTSRTYESLFGTVIVRRWRYTQRETYGISPLDQALKLPGCKYSYAVQERVCQEAVRAPFDEAVETLKQYTGARMPKKQALEAVSRAATSVDKFYEGRSAGRRMKDTPIVVMTI